MDYGLASNMMVNVAEPQLQYDSAIEAARKLDIDDSQITMLELEIENLTLELEDEKKKSTIERAECAKHLQELEAAERELLRCQTAFQESEQKLAEAQVEIRDKNKELADADEELIQRRQHVGKLEQRMERIAGRNQQEAQSHEVKADKSASKPARSQKHRGRSDPTSQQKTSSLNQMNEVLQESQTRLTIQIETLEDQVKVLRRELQIAQIEAANKMKEMDALRGSSRGIEQRKLNKGSTVQQAETEMEKTLRIKDSIIGRHTYQIEELQLKAKRIPQLSSQLSKLETLNATLKSQNAALAADMKTSIKAFELRENEMREKFSKSNFALEAKTMATKSQYEKEIAEVKFSRDALEQEKKILESRILHLEQVRAKRHLNFGIVFCVDLSGSLSGNPEQLAKDAFRKLIDDLCLRSPEAHVGVVVQASTIYVAHQMDKVNPNLSSVLDSIACQGSEDYLQAFVHVVSLLSAFKASYPDAGRRVIMISDGEDFISLGDVSMLIADGVPCHNITVDKGYGGLGSTYLVGTGKYSSMTGGGNFKYDGSHGLGDIDILIKP